MKEQKFPCRRTCGLRPRRAQLRHVQPPAPGHLVNGLRESAGASQALNTEPDRNRPEASCDPSGPLKPNSKWDRTGT